LIDIKGIRESTRKTRYEGQLNGGDWALAIDVNALDAKNFTGTGEARAKFKVQGYRGSAWVQAVPL
jgi:hypothetical protein